MRVADGELRGRGSVDANGSLFAAICALSRIDERDGIYPVVVPYEEGGSETARRSTLVRSFLRSMRSLDLKPIFKRKTGTCDMNILGNAWDAPILAYGPGDGRLDHTDNERITVDEYLRSIDVLDRAIRDIVGI